jgi:protein CpxP
MNVIKHRLMALAALAGALSLQPLVQAADGQTPSQSAIAGRQAALRERIQDTVKELNLTEEQRQKLQVIVRAQATKLRDLRQDSGLSPAERRQKVQALREEITSQVKQVLTPEQFEKWQARQGRLGAAGRAPLARVQEAIRDLNLTDQQKEQLKPIYQEQAEKLRELYLDSSLSIPEKLEKLKGMRAEIAPKLKKVMDADQYAKWEKDVDQWVEQLRQRFQGSGQN